MWVIVSLLKSCFTVRQHESDLTGGCERVVIYLPYVLFAQFLVTCVLQSHNKHNASFKYASLLPFVSLNLVHWDFFQQGESNSTIQRIE